MLPDSWLDCWQLTCCWIWCVTCCLSASWDAAAQLPPNANDRVLVHVFLPAGIYEIVNSHSTQLAYKLQLPEVPGKVQEELNIGAEGTFKVSIKV